MIKMSSKFKITGLGQMQDNIKKLENNRNNSILNYLPEYENLFRSNGY